MFLKNGKRTEGNKAENDESEQKSRKFDKKLTPKTDTKGSFVLNFKKLSMSESYHSCTFDHSVPKGN